MVHSIVEAVDFHHCVHYIEQKDGTAEWVTRKGYMRDSLYKSYSGRRQLQRSDCTGEGPSRYTCPMPPPPPKYCMR